MRAIYTMRGVQDLLEVFEDRVAITPKGVLGLLNKGIKGTKEIHFASIVAVQFKEAGVLSGYLQFTIPGGNESRGGIFAATKDENTFMFRGGENNAKAKEIKEYINAAIRRSRAPHIAAPASNLSDELERLAKLKEQGILSDEEFQIVKGRLLGGLPGRQPAFGEPPSASRTIEKNRIDEARLSPSTPPSSTSRRTQNSVIALGPCAQPAVVQTALVHEKTPRDGGREFALLSTSALLRVRLKLFHYNNALRLRTLADRALGWRLGMVLIYLALLLVVCLLGDLVIDKDRWLAAFFVCVSSYILILHYVPKDAALAKRVQTLANAARGQDRLTSLLTLEHALAAAVVILGCIAVVGFATLLFQPTAERQRGSPVGTVQKPIMGGQSKLSPEEAELERDLAQDKKATERKRQQDQAKPDSANAAPRQSKHNSIPADLTYSVIEDNGNGRLRVRLNRTASKEVLGEVAMRLQEQFPNSHNPSGMRDVCFYLPAMDPGYVAWAIASFDPAENETDWSIRIQGLTAEEERRFASSSDEAPGRTIVGTWLDDTPYMERRLTIVRKGGRVFVEHRYKDSSGGETEVTESKSSAGRRFDYTRATARSLGGYYLINSAGDLEDWVKCESSEELRLGPETKGDYGLYCRARKLQ